MLVKAVEQGATLVMDDIKKGMDKRKLNASGRTSASLRVVSEVSKERIRTQVLGSRVFLLLQKGRRPNKSGKPSREQIKGLTEWVKHRNIPVSAVWAIATKQAREGTPVPNPYNIGGVLSESLDNKRVLTHLVPLLKSSVIKSVRDILTSQ